MKKVAEIRATLEKIFNSGLNMQLFLGTGSRDKRLYFLADFDQNASEAVAKTYVQGLKSFFETPDLEALPLSEMDHRADTLFCYDLAHAPDEFAQLKALVDAPSPKVFSAKAHELTEIKTLVVKLSSPDSSVLFFKTFYPVSLVKRDQILLVVKNDKRFSLLDSDVIKITAGFEVMLLDGEFYLNDFSKFEKTFAFEDIAKATMKATVDKIIAMDLVDDAKGYLSAFLASKKDILRAEKSPVLNLKSKIILKFVKTRQKLIGLKLANGKIDLSTKVSVKHLFKLLNDDYLRSELTSLNYETLAKNKLVG